MFRNCVEFAIHTIVNAGDIDDYLLKLAFNNPNANFGSNWFNYYDDNASVEQGIREKVIYQTVLKECNVNGGTIELIDITGSRMESIGNGYLHVNVPDAILGGRDIIKVIEVYQGALNSSNNFISAVNGSQTFSQNGILAAGLESFLTAISPNSFFQQTFVDITPAGKNAFIIHNAPPGAYALTAKMYLTYDKGLTVISPRAWIDFAELCILATKAYIYKTCRRPTEEAVRRAGVNLDSIRDDIQNYADAWKEYREFFDTTWTKRMAYEDPKRKADTIFATTPRRI